MKILGKTNDEGFIVQIAESELEMILRSYYDHDIPSLKKRILDSKSGDVINGSSRYNFVAGIKISCRSIIEASKNLKTAQETLQKFAEMILETGESN